jgi:hypothetical protein
VGHSYLLSGFHVTKSADSKRLADAAALWKDPSVSSPFSCYAFPSQISLSADSSALFPAQWKMTFVP